LKILLINPPYFRAAEFPPIGLLYIAAVLLKEKHDVKIIDLDNSSLKQKLNFDDYDIVGISTLTFAYDKILKIAKLAKKHNKIVVAGGWHATFEDEEMLKTGLFDFIIRGEGEITFLKLIKALEENKEPHFKGISYIKEGKIVRTDISDPIEDLDSLPFPARHLLPPNKYKKIKGEIFTPLIATRGCRFNCKFCATPAMRKRKWFHRSVENIIKEMLDVEENFKIRGFALLDENFMQDEKWVYHFCESLSKYKKKFLWMCQARFDVLAKNKELVKMMAKAGCVMIHIGFESPFQKSIDFLSKGERVNQIKTAVKNCKEAGIDIIGSFMLGIPTESRWDAKNLITFARNLDIDVAWFQILTPFPGTKLCKELNIVTKKYKFYELWHLVFRHPYMSNAFARWLIFFAVTSFYISRIKKVIYRIFKKKISYTSFIAFLKKAFRYLFTF